MNFDKLIDYFKLDKQEFNFQFNSHPNYPSALAFSDTLNFLGVKNDAYELDKEYWDELPEEFMTLYDNSFSLVKKKEGFYTIYSDKITHINKEELYKNSSDFVLLFEKKENVKTKSFFNFTPVVYVVFALITLYSLLQFTWYESLFNVLSLAGIFISLELFNQKFGQESAVVSNICGVPSNQASQSSCSKIFTSDKTNILGLKLSDISLVYFLGITFVGLLFPQTQSFLKITSLISVIVIFYSAYTQVFVEKSLCRVCLVIIGILTAQIAISSIYFSWNLSLAVFFIGLIIFLSLFFMISYLNNVLNQKEELKKSNAKNLRFKRNYDLFKRELLDSEKIDFSDKKTFLLGSKDAKLHISVVSNPYCGFCKGAHEIIDDLLSQYPEEISAQMRFNYSDNKAEVKYTQLLSDFLSLYKNKPQHEFLKAVHSWFENKNENEIKIKANSQVLEDLTAINQMTAENSAAGLNFTPVFIINGYQFPDKYDREDIHYFINELIEDEYFPE